MFKRIFGTKPASNPVAKAPPFVTKTELIDKVEAMLQDGVKGGVTLKLSYRTGLYTLTSIVSREWGQQFDLTGNESLQELAAERGIRSSFGESERAAYWTFHASDNDLSDVLPFDN